MLTREVIDGRYRLLDELGAGGMSVVWRAHDEVLDRPVAVKVLAGPKMSETGARGRIRAEAQAAARLWHPNVTNVYDYGEATDDAGATLPYVVMELLPGRTLSQRLAAGPLPARAALRICAEVAAALAAAHAVGLVHRDVKPSNVMLTPAGAKVFDFGIAAAAGRAELEADGQLLGTPAYLAPERLTAGEVLPASDVYALGLLIYRVLTNRLPWLAETTTQMLRAQVYVQPAPLPAVADVSAVVNELCDRCLTKDPVDRPSAAEVAALLSAAAGIVPLPEDDESAAGAWEAPATAGDAPGPSSAGPAAAAPRAAVVRRRLVRAGAVGLVLLAVTAAATTLSRPDAPTDRTRAAPPAELESRQPSGPGGVAVGATPAAGADPTAAPPASRTALPPGTGRATPPGGGSSVGVPPGNGGTQPTTAGTTSTPSRPGAPVQAKGGVVRVRCNGSTATVLGVDMAAGYSLKDYDPGPAAEVQVVLLSSTNESEIKVRCGAGGPIPSVKESPQ